MVAGMKIRYWVLRDWLKENNLSPRELADEIGLSDEQVCEIENKRIFLTERQIRRLVYLVGAEKALDVLDFSHKINLFNLAKTAVFGGVCYGTRC